MLDFIDRISANGLNVLITGESGVCKRLMARLIHSRSPWRGRPFKRFSAHDLSWRRSRLWEPQGEGTVFIDDVGRMGGEAQTMLLRHLETSTYDFPGPPAPRLITASRDDFFWRVEEGVFRKDLYFQLNAIHLHLPPLRERRNELPDLVRHLAVKYERRFRRRLPPLTPTQMELMVGYPWPGNFRELDLFVRRLHQTGDSELLFAQLSKWPGEVRAFDRYSLDSTLRRAERLFEQRVIGKLMKRNRGNWNKTARDIGVSDQTLLHLLRELQRQEKADEWT